MENRIQCQSARLFIADRLSPSLPSTKRFSAEALARSGTVTSRFEPRPDLSPASLLLDEHLVQLETGLTGFASGLAGDTSWGRRARGSQSSCMKPWALWLGILCVCFESSGQRSYTLHWVEISAAEHDSQAFPFYCQLNEGGRENVNQTVKFQVV